MLSTKLHDALNDQINAEYYSGYLYLAMSSYLASLNMDGAANWMRIQAQEELMHGMKIYDYLIGRGERVLLQSVAKPPPEWGSVLEAFEDAHKHERKMTGMINGLADMAQTEKDFATSNLMQWFVDEQVEEEATVDSIVQKIKMLGADGPGMFMIDRELKQRVATPLDGGKAGG